MNSDIKGQFAVFLLFKVKMVRNYKRKTNKRDAGALQCALRAILHNGLAIRKAARLSGIPEATLRRHRKNIKANELLSPQNSNNKDVEGLNIQPHGGGTVNTFLPFHSVRTS